MALTVRVCSREENEWIEGSRWTGRRGETAPLPHWLILRSSLAAIGWAAGAVVPCRPTPPVPSGVGIAGAGLGGGSGDLKAVSAGLCGSGPPFRGVTRTAGGCDGAGLDPELGRAGRRGLWHGRRTWACAGRRQRASRGVFPFLSDYCFGFFCRKFSD